MIIEPNAPKTPDSSKHCLLGCFSITIKRMLHVTCEFYDSKSGFSRTDVGEDGKTTACVCVCVCVCVRACVRACVCQPCLM